MKLFVKLRQQNMLWCPFLSQVLSYSCERPKLGDDNGDVRMLVV